MIISFTVNFIVSVGYLENDMIHTSVPNIQETVFVYKPHVTSFEPTVFSDRLISGICGSRSAPREIDGKIN